MADNEKTTEHFLTAVAILPAASAAVGTNWLPTLVAALASVLLYLFLPDGEELQSKWIKRARVFAIILLIAYYLSRTSACWPEKGAECTVPGMLGLLSLYAVCRGKSTAAQSSNVLRYGINLVLLVILYVNVRNIQWKSMTPSGEFPKEELLIALMLPLLGKRRQRRKSLYVPAVALLISIITAGTSAQNLYAYSRTISIHGVTEHVESVAAMVMTMAYYALLSFLLVLAEENMSDTNKKWKLMACLIVSYVITILKLEINGVVVIALMGTLWCIVPRVEEIKRKLSKEEKSA